MYEFESKFKRKQTDKTLSLPPSMACEYCNTEYIGYDDVVLNFSPRLEWHGVTYEIYCLECREEFCETLASIFEHYIKSGRKSMSSHTVASSLPFHICGTCKEVIVGDSLIEKYTYLSGDSGRRSSECKLCAHFRHTNK